MEAGGRLDPVLLSAIHADHAPSVGPVFLVGSSTRYTSTASTTNSLATLSPPLLLGFSASLASMLSFPSEPFPTTSRQSLERGGAAVVVAGFGGGRDAGGRSQIWEREQRRWPEPGEGATAVPGRQWSSASSSGMYRVILIGIT
uniref:Uncharacterized protein n=1 Tax=Oryza glumipatula TaxID=40148 RepID=A0A0D9ZGI5_9ORYZ